MADIERIAEQWRNGDYSERMPHMYEAEDYREWAEALTGFGHCPRLAVCPPTS